jgi:hypothetical protein
MEGDDGTPKVKPILEEEEGVPNGLEEEEGVPNANALHVTLVLTVDVGVETKPAGDVEPLVAEGTRSDTPEKGFDDFPVDGVALLVLVFAPPKRVGALVDEPLVAEGTRSDTPEKGFSDFPVNGVALLVDVFAPPNKVGALVEGGPPPNRLSDGAGVDLPKKPALPLFEEDGLVVSWENPERKARAVQ